MDPTPIAPEPAGPRRATGLAVLLSAYICVTLLLYADRMPWNHEEPRRAIVAQEMLLSGDWVAPTIYQAPYFKKPPLHNWLIALTALDDHVVTPTGARMVSIGAFLLLGGAVFALLRRRSPAAALLGFVVVTTNYLLLCEYGNLAESDMVLALVTFLSYAVYIVDPLRPINIAVSAVFMGLGILTKGVSPIFFYPPLLALAFLEPGPRRRRLGLLALHAALSVVLPLIWLLALHSRGTAGRLLATGESELVGKAKGAFWDYPKHIVVYPVRMFLVLLPWSAAVALWRRPATRDAIYRSSLLGLGSSLAVFTLAAGSCDRYFIPAIPFFAIVAAYRIDAERRVGPWITRVVLGIVALASAGGGVNLLILGNRLQGVILLAVGVAVGLLASRRHRVWQLGLTVALAVFTVFMHGIYFRRTIERVPSYPPAQAVAAAMTHPWPLMVDSQLDVIHIAVDLEGILQRPVYDRKRFNFAPAYLMTNPSRLDPRGREILRLPYPRRGIGQLVLQEIGPDSTASGPAGR
jgi:4-amino-4-deoxy-L-arabinose transferase-like glycosyltransferase